MDCNIMVYLGLIYSVYALINLLCEVSDFEVYFRIRKDKDNTSLKIIYFLSNNHNMKMCILFILDRYKYYTYMGMILLLNN